VEVVTEVVGGQAVVGGDTTICPTGLGAATARGALETQWPTRETGAAAALEMAAASASDPIRAMENHEVADPARDPIGHPQQSSLP